MLVAVMGSPWEQAPLLPGLRPCTPLELHMAPSQPTAFPGGCSVQMREHPRLGSGFLYLGVHDHEHNGSN